MNLNRSWCGALFMTTFGCRAWIVCLHTETWYAVGHEDLVSEYSRGLESPRYSSSRIAVTTKMGKHIELCPSSRSNWSSANRLPVSLKGQSMKSDMSNIFKVIAYALMVASMLSIAHGARADEAKWLTEMSSRLKLRVPNEKHRITLLNSVQTEASRSGLDPQLVLSLIDVASGFKKYAMSTEGARGYMQVSPHWVKLIGAPGDDLFDMRKNIRYGCVILRHFLDLENGDLLKALGQYRSQMGESVKGENQHTLSASDFPKAVEGMSKTRWRYDVGGKTSSSRGLMDSAITIGKVRNVTTKTS